MIKTKLKSILNAREAVQKLIKKDLPVAVSFRVAKLVNAMNVELAVYDAERNKLCEKYGKLNESKTEYKIIRRDEFQKELISLFDIELELDANKVVLPKETTITPADLIALDDFVEVENDD